MKVTRINSSVQISLLDRARQLAEDLKIVTSLEQEESIIRRYDRIVEKLGYDPIS